MLDDYRNYSQIRKSQVAGMERIADRAGVTEQPWRQWPCFKNREGAIYMPNSLLVDLAIAFAKAEPETVLLYLDLEREKMLAEGYWRGERHQHEEILKTKPVWAIIHQWVGSKPSRDHLREEIERMRRLMWQAVEVLEQNGLAREATRIRRTLEGA